MIERIESSLGRILQLLHDGVDEYTLERSAVSKSCRVLGALEASLYTKNTAVVFRADSDVVRASCGLIGKGNRCEHDSVHG
jgi:hypothetical protein